jgi:hypothetical protein
VFVFGWIVGAGARNVVVVSRRVLDRDVVAVVVLSVVRLAAWVAPPETSRPVMMRACSPPRIRFVFILRPSLDERTAGSGRRDRNYEPDGRVHVKGFTRGYLFR